MFELNKKISKVYDRSIPDVSFYDDGVLWNIVGLINTEHNIYQYMGLLMLRLGFKPEDKLVFMNYSVSDNSFDCILNKDGRYHSYRIQFKNKDKQIVMSHNNMIYGYVCEELPFGELGMRVSLGSYTYEYADGMVFTRDLSKEKAKFSVSMCGRMIELEFGKPNDVNVPMFDDNGLYAKYRLECEDELSKYITSLSNFNKQAIDIYSELCQSYFGDISNYPEFILRVSDIDQDEVSNLIYLRYGELEKILITNDKARVFLDKDSNSYVELLTSGEYPVKFCMSCKDSIETYSFSPLATTRLKDYTSNGISKDIDLAYDQLLDVNIKVRRLFKKGS